MTPQERQLVADLFRRLAPLERNPRDPEAEGVIREGLAQAPHAVYALVQTVLLQDEALRMADERIRSLEASGGRAQADEQPRGFLDNLRDSMFGSGGRDDERRGSVPSAGRRLGEPMGSPMGAPSGGGLSPWGGAGRDAPQGGAFGGAPMGRGPFGGGGMAAGSPGAGSFLGTAAAVAAGAVGGGLLMNGIRSMMGGSGTAGEGGSPFQSAFDKLAGGTETGGAGAAAGSSELAREAGVGDVGNAGSGDRVGYAGDSAADDYGTDYGTDVADADFDDGGDFGGDFGGSEEV